MIAVLGSTLLLLLSSCGEASSAQGLLGSCTDYRRGGGPIELDVAVSSEVVNETAVENELQCVLRCRARRCAVAVLPVNGSGLCQLVVIHSESAAPGPAGSHQRRRLGSEAGAVVWRADNFEALLSDAQRNVNPEFLNASSGRFGSVQRMVVMATGCYRLEARGAAGGGSSNSLFGGRGATVAGNFSLTGGSQLEIVVGQSGGSSVTYAGGGGGGGSFIYQLVSGNISQLLVAAGGGGGASTWRDGLAGQGGVNGSDALLYDANYVQTGFGGVNGNPGFNDPSSMSSSTDTYVKNHNHGGCGAGWLGGPLNPRRGVRDGEGGSSRIGSWVGGAAGNGGAGHGGFGGGGGGGIYINSPDSYGAAGAGGGFSGGGASLRCLDGGGGGGSFCGGGSCVTAPGASGTSAGPEQGRVAMRLLSTQPESSCL